MCKHRIDGAEIADQRLWIYEKGEKGDYLTDF